MGFDASTAVEPLDYDFTHFASRDPVLADAKGVIDEPSDEAVQKMQRQFAEATKAFRDASSGDGPPLAELDRDVFEASETAILEAVAEVCNGSPSREQLAALPYRHKRRFLTWLQRQLMNPES